MYNVREQFHNVINFRKIESRLPMVEWAAWWDKTTDGWKGEGLPQHLNTEEILRHFNLDEFPCVFIWPDSGLHAPYHGGPVIEDEVGYDAIMDKLYPEGCIKYAIEQAQALAERHKKGEVIVRVWLDGFFWFPRKLLGIENHLFAFYDQPELLHRMAQDLAEYNLRGLEAVFNVLTPDMVGFAEDMSYNNGPMLSHENFLEFLKPYYNKIVPYIKEKGVTAWVDTDGDVTQMIPWLLDSGIDGIFPLEKQAGVDVAKIRADHPKLLMLGAFDKMCMKNGEAAMRAEFERLLPVMKSGGFLPSVDHQTPPDVSLENYGIYVRLFEEYCKKAV